MKKLLLLLILLVPAQSMAVEIIPTTPAMKEALFNDISSNLMCLCGCGTTIKTCPHENCSFAIPARKEIRRLIEMDISREEIFGEMVSRYGEVILASPTFRGFNIMAWITPFIAIFFVGSAVFLMIRKWVDERRIPADTSPPAVGEETAEDDPYLKRMREELKKFED